MPAEIGVIRCPAVRSLVQNELLHHDQMIAVVDELVHVFSGQPRKLKLNEPGSLANVAGFFAIFNHGVREKGHHRFIDFFRLPFRDAKDSASALQGNDTDRLFDLHFLGSDGDHDGTVDFFTNNAAGTFDATHFANTVKGDTLTINGIATMIITANQRDPKASTIDLVKSSGEWALMVCALRRNKETTDIAVTDLEQLYRDEDSQRLLEGTRIATGREWIGATITIASEIAKERGERLPILSALLHQVFEKFNVPQQEKACPCMTCNESMWTMSSS